MALGSIDLLQYRGTAKYWSSPFQRRGTPWDRWEKRERQPAPCFNVLIRPHRLPDFRIQRAGVAERRSSAVFLFATKTTVVGLKTPTDVVDRHHEGASGIIAVDNSNNPIVEKEQSTKGSLSPQMPAERPSLPRISAGTVEVYNTNFKPVLVPVHFQPEASPRLCPVRHRPCSGN